MPVYQRNKKCSAVRVKGHGLIQPGAKIDTHHDFSQSLGWRLLDEDSAADAMPMSIKSFAELSFKDAKAYAERVAGITKVRSRLELAERYGEFMKTKKQEGISPGPQASEPGDLANLHTIDPRTGLME